MRVGCYVTTCSRSIASPLALSVGSRANALGSRRAHRRRAQMTTKHLLDGLVVGSLMLPGFAISITVLQIGLYPAGGAKFPFRPAGHGRPRRPRVFRRRHAGMYARRRTMRTRARP